VRAWPHKEKNMADQATIDTVASHAGERYKYGFVTDIESEKAPKGLNTDIVRYISARKNEPEWMLAWRLQSFERWQTMREPDWAKLNYAAIDYQDLY
jgi:Fe-S cluster assembly protein SufB